ncbi:hypothetical protein [Nocardia vaccinii]|uniref:hypothetical protein n=1 Tax=Nocardia vaccinii TaxID=1822 RepID=UPI000A667822|nr:hypothetical protein [Nocardia vaccinii]
MDAHLFGRFGGDVRSFTLPEERDEFDQWAAHCRTTARDTEEFDNLHRMVTGYMDTAAEAKTEGKFVSINWTDGTAGESSLVVEYRLLPPEVKEDGGG